MGNPQSSPTRLSERDAWAVATAWHPQIRGIMGLRSAFPVAEPAPPTSDTSPRVRPVLLRPTFSVMSSVEFVDFVFTWVHADDLERLVLAARAATLAWFVLACCPGYGGDENPHFWWRVLAASSAPFKYDGPIHHTDVSRVHAASSNSFFPNPNRPFPSVRVSAPSQQTASTLELFLFGMETAKRDKKLLAAMHKLVPFVCETRWRRDLPVAVCSTEFGAVADFLVDAAQRPSPRATAHSLFKSLVVAEVHSVSESYVGVAEVDAVIAADDNVRVCFSDSLDAASVFAQSNRLGQSQMAHKRLRERLPRVRVDTLELCSSVVRSDQSPTASYFQTCCLMLPHTNAIESVSVVVRRGETLLTDVDAAWLGYAIFCPDFEIEDESSFTNLTLHLGSASETVLPIIKLMSKGNNLLVAMGVTNEVSTVYHQACVRVGSRVWSTREEADGEGEGFESESKVLWTSNREDMWLTVCFENPSNASLQSIDTSVRIIVPGVGIGWVSISSLTKIRTRPPGASRIRRLRLFRHVGADQVLRFAVGTDIIGVLSLLGNRLSFLELDGTGPLSASELQAALVCCPNLKSLRVHHGGSCWSDATGITLPEVPRLEELDLIVNGSLRPLRAPQLGSLQVLRVGHVSPGTFRANLDAFVSVLELCPDLRSFMWLAAPTSFSEYYDLTLQVLEGIIRPNVNDKARVPLTVASRVAFLSVVTSFASHQPMHPLSGMGDPAIARRIFDFSSSFEPRQFHISDRAH